MYVAWMKFPIFRGFILIALHRGLLNWSEVLAAKNWSNNQNWSIYQMNLLLETPIGSMEIWSINQNWSITQCTRRAPLYSIRGITQIVKSNSIFINVKIAKNYPNYPPPQAFWRDPAPFVTLPLIKVLCNRNQILRQTWKQHLIGTYHILCRDKWETGNSGKYHFKSSH